MSPSNQDSVASAAPHDASFPLGQVVITRGALESLNSVDALMALDRHAACDWGDCGEMDRRLNDLAVAEESRLLSVYHDGSGKKFWIITEANRSVTTVLLPEDF